MTTIIKAKKDLFNKGKCFSKGKEYTIPNRQINTEAGLMEARTVNDLNEPHIIGDFWRNFKIVRYQ